eukprot:CAMPEP_0196665294 /NCGR_PEP_ID=MMETSP1086-20130531/60343_1 /TAXON_ID=77921 /ORGANISM="Cyanoptyche  gloeocystis , Strain SAG4.97" /LENGTH=122 /DNA_ID=CAMNT_0042001953 /DNA_START=417 /DNA_END=785 /DNA_ORIENTATION=+
MPFAWTLCIKRGLLPFLHVADSPSWCEPSPTRTFALESLGFSEHKCEGCDVAQHKHCLWMLLGQKLHDQQKNKGIIRGVAETGLTRQVFKATASTMCTCCDLRGPYYDLRGRYYDLRVVITT